ncbi:two-component system sensor histidine kinase NtrB [Oceanisphaera marina]|uniref:Sensory histidine kinase/phosphatase NtrB n=1 Tax=Oceanisphaera marina TaxID=2017550 RepID=A0ABQ1IKC8_9GAMM|nr:nitrogen regulation protein NR(II) [Oceanisphaera marina]GGB43630.1 two-component system sensor histidine kinase NtrB [Oceanisphaera marina]
MGSQANAAAIIDNLLTAVLVVDAKLQVHFANNAAEQLLPLSKRRLQATPVNLADEDISLDMNRIRRCIDTEQGFTDSEVQLMIDGIPRWVEVNVTPITLPLPGVESNHMQALIELRLIDQQKKISQELQQRTQQQAARELVRGLAHEIKNPLGGLRGAAQLLERELPRPELKEFTQLIIAQADRLRNLVDRLLGPQRLGERRVTNLHSVLEQVRQLVAMDIPSGIRLDRDYDPSIPDLEMDPEQLQQAILNIVRNATEVLQEHGHILMKTRTAFQVMLHGHRYRLAAEIRIIDNGPGIPESLRDTLFYPMVTGRDGGTGLGLSIAQDLIHQHQGRIEIQSCPGRTEFIIYLPLRR